jgi:hypothetical protein
VRWWIADRRLHLGKAGTELVYRVRASIFPSDGGAVAPHVLSQGRQGSGDYRLFYTESPGYLAVSFESRDTPGKPWGHGGQNRPVGWTPYLGDAMDCQTTLVSGSRFVWGLVTDRATRVVMRDKASGRVTDLKLYRLPGAKHFQAYGGFVGTPPRGSTIVAYDAAGAELGKPFAPYW